MARIAIVGAGMSGLSAAHYLSETTAEITVFDKSRGVSGRMATRYADDYCFDHGAQFFTVRSEAFQQFLAPYIDTGVVQPWSARFVEIVKDSITAQRDWLTAHPHYVAVPNMNTLLKAVAAPFSLRLNTHVSRMSQVKGQWQLEDESGQLLGQYDWVILALPAPQAKLLIPSTSTLSAIPCHTMQGCFTLMLGLKPDTDLPAWDAALVRQSKLSWVSVQSAKPGRKQRPALVVHSTNQWAEENMEVDIHKVKQSLLEALAMIIPLSEHEIDHCGIHRWRYANAAKSTDNHDCFIDHQRQLAACGDWCIKGRVEAAFLSGRSAAQHIAAVL